MIRRQQPKAGTVKVTFVVPDSGAPVSVVGDFNDWDALAHPLRKRSNGTRSIAVEIAEGRTVRFRYLGPDGWFFDDPDADAVEPNGYGDTHTLLRL